MWLEVTVAVQWHCGTLILIIEARRELQPMLSTGTGAKDVAGLARMHCLGE
jgi:hypothetical protein